MESHLANAFDSRSGDELVVRALFHELLECWNRRRADEFAALFEKDGNAIGFDGSQHNGQAEIESTLDQIFADHQTASYVAKIKEVRFLSPDIAVLRAVAGMVPPGQSDLNPAVNAIQTLVSVRHAEGWRIAVFQNTPAAFHGRPELSERLSAELRDVLRARVQRVPERQA
jgi:uncharacterized protein (TIGR02246 family)